MRKLKQKIVVLFLFPMMISIIACGENASSGRKGMDSNDIENGYKILNLDGSEFTGLGLQEESSSSAEQILETEPTQHETQPTQEKSTVSKIETAVTGDLYTDVENQQLFAKNGVIVDRNDEILDEYSWLICLQNGALYDRESDAIAEDFSTREDGMLYYRIPDEYKEAEPNRINEIVEKLLSGTSGNHKKEAYLFDSGYWKILIKEDRLSIQFPSDDYIKDRFDLILGENEGNADSFVYNLKDETIVFSFYNVQVLEGNLEAVIYDRNQEVFYLLIDGEYYDPSDEFAGYMEDYALMDAVGSELPDFRKELSHMGLTVEDLKELDYTGLCEALDW